MILPHPHSVRCRFEAKMLFPILLLNLVLFSLTSIGADAKSSPKQGLEDLVEKLEFRLREVETRLESKEKEIETRLEALEDKMKEEKEEAKKRERALEESKSKPRLEVVEHSNYSKTALTNPSFPIVLISVWHQSWITTPQTVTFDVFLANYNIGGGDGMFDLDSGVFTCFTPGYYTVSFSAYCRLGPNNKYQYLFLYKNGAEVSESGWTFWNPYGGLNDVIGVTSSRTVVSNLLDIVA